jgi:hypothetical protein
MAAREVIGYVLGTEFAAACRDEVKAMSWRLVFCRRVRRARFAGEFLLTYGRYVKRLRRV